MRFDRTGSVFTKDGVRLRERVSTIESFLNYAIICGLISDMTMGTAREVIGRNLLQFLCA